MLGPPSYGLDALITDIWRILDAQGQSRAGLNRMGECLQRMVTHGGNLWELGHPRKTDMGLDARLYYVDILRGFRLLLLQFPPGEPTPVHSHLTWGVECVCEGANRYTSWKRLDDGESPGHARLELFADQTVAKGNLAFWFDPPGNIHRQTAVGTSASTVLALFGGDTARQQIFNLETGTYIEAGAPDE